MTMKVYSAVLLLSLGMEMTVGLHALPALTAGKSLPVTFEWGWGGSGWTPEGIWAFEERNISCFYEEYLVGCLGGRLAVDRTFNVTVNSVTSHK